MYDTVSGNIAAEIPSLCNNGEKETEDQISSINSIAFNPAGKNILVGCENGCLFLWNIDDNSGHKQTSVAAGTGSGKQSGNLLPQDGLQVADGENSSGSGRNSAVPGTGRSGGTGNGDGEQSTGTGGSAGEQSTGTGIITDEQSVGESGTGNTTAEQGAGQSGTGNQISETGAGTGAADSLQQQKNNSAHHVTVSAGIGSIDTNLYRFTLHLNAGYFYSVSSLFFFGGTLSLRDSLPAGDFPYKYETPTEYLNPPSVYSVSVCGCGGLEFYPKDFIRVFVQADVGANMRFLWNTSVSSSVAGTPRFGAVTSLFAGAEFWGARVGGGIEYDTNFGFSGFASVGYTFRFGTEKK